MRNIFLPNPIYSEKHAPLQQLRRINQPPSMKTADNLAAPQNPPTPIKWGLLNYSLV